MKIRNMLIQGNCFEYLHLIENNVFDLIILDPPYNISQNISFDFGNSSISLDFGEWDWFKSQDEYLSMIGNLLTSCYRILKESGMLYMFFSVENNSFIVKMAILFGFSYKGPYIWYKPNPPPRVYKKGYANCFEMAGIFSKNKKEEKLNFLGDRYMRNVFVHPIVSGNERIKDDEGCTLHPTQKAEALIERWMRVSSDEGDLVGDFMAGSGTVPLVAKRLNRDYFAIEQNEKYYKKMVERVEGWKKPKKISDMMI